jgi:hypothetical protein
MHPSHFAMYNAVYIGITSQCFGKVLYLHLLGYATTNSEDSHQAPATSVTKYRSMRRHNRKTEISKRNTPLQITVHFYILTFGHDMHNVCRQVPDPTLQKLKIPNE